MTLEDRGCWPLWLHPVTVEAAPTPPRLVGLIRRPVRLAGGRLRRPCRSALLSPAAGVGVFCQRPRLTVLRYSCRSVPKVLFVVLRRSSGDGSL